MDDDLDNPEYVGGEGSGWNLHIVFVLLLMVVAALAGWAVSEYAHEKRVEQTIERDASPDMRPATVANFNTSVTQHVVGEPDGFAKGLKYDIKFDAKGDRMLTGLVRNESKDKAWPFLMLRVCFEDDDGAQYGQCYFTYNRLGPGEVWKFWRHVDEVAVTRIRVCSFFAQERDR